MSNRPPLKRQRTHVSSPLPPPSRPASEVFLFGMPARKRARRSAPIARSGYQQRNRRVNRRGTGRGAQGFIPRRRGIGQYPYSKRTNLPETKLKRVPPVVRQWETNAHDMAYLPVKGELFVPGQYATWNQGIGLSNVTGTQALLKNITGRIKVHFEDDGVNNKPWNFRLVTGFCKMGEFKSLEDTSSLAVNPFPEGVVLNYADDTLQQHVTQVLRDSVGNLDGVLNAAGGIDSRLALITGDMRFQAPWETQATIAGGAAVSRPDIIKTFNWNCNKRVKLYPVSTTATVALAAATHTYAPVNDPRPLIPFCMIFCTNVEDHPENQAAMPTLTFESCSYWSDC